MSAGELVDAINAVLRARTAVGELNTSRTSEDIERVRKGVEHELETALRAFGVDWMIGAGVSAVNIPPEFGDDVGEQPNLWS